MLDDTEVARASGTSSASAQPTQSTGPTTNTAIVPTDDQVGARSEILGHILQHTAPAPLPAAWSFLPPKESVRTLLGTRSALVASLKGSFSEEELRAAKIVTGDSANELQLSPVLCEDKFQVISGAHGVPVDLASDAGLLLGDDPPCFRFACQRIGVTGRDKRIFIAALADLQIFECLGLRCTPDAGLASLDGQQARRLFANLSSSSLPRYWPTLVGVSVANLEYKLPSHIMPILNRLEDAKTFFKRDPFDDFFLIWRPDEEVFNRIPRAVTFSDRETIRREILATLDNSVRCNFDAYIPHREPDQNELELAHADLRRATETPDSYGFGHDLRAAANRIREAIARVTTRRFIQAAATASTPQESQAHLMRAEIIQDLNHSYGPLRAARSRDGAYDPTLTEERWEKIERCTNELLKIERLSPFQK